MGYGAGEEKGICNLATCFCLQQAENKCFCIIGFKTLIVKKTDFFFPVLSKQDEVRSVM